jgi:hypothetical protein
LNTAFSDNSYNNVRFPELKVKPMPLIRIPQKHWGKVWRVLVAAGPVSRNSQDTIYHVSEQQVRLLRKKKLPFEPLRVEFSKRDN